MHAETYEANPDLALKRITHDAITILQEAAENHIIGFFEDAHLQSGTRKTLLLRDFQHTAAQRNTRLIVPDSILSFLEDDVILD